MLLSCSKPVAEDSTGAVISPDILDFGRIQSSAIITLTNLQSTSLSWNATVSNSWIQLDKVAGNLRGGANELIEVNVSRAGLSAGIYSGYIEFNLSGIKKVIPIGMEIVSSEKPIVTIGEYSGLTYQSVTISGSLISVGTSDVSSYGICWNRTGNPTIDDEHTNLGDSKQPQSFESHISGLAANTHYYFKAYAQNNSGISYSDDYIELLTKDYSLPDDPDNPAIPDEPDYSEAVVDTDLENLEVRLASCTRDGDEVTLTFTLTNTYAYGNMNVTLNNVNAFTQKTFISDDLGNQYSKQFVKISLAGKDWGYGNNIEGTLLPDIPVKCIITVKAVNTDAKYMSYYIYTATALPGSVAYSDNVILRNVKIH